MARKKKNTEPQILFPPNIHQLALDFCQERLKKEAVEQKRKADKAKEMKQQHRFRLQHGLADAKRVFAWASAFRKSDIGRELMWQSHIPTASRGVFFYDGHVEGVDWVGLGISADGLFLDRGGRMSALTRQIVKSAFDLAVAVDPKVLREVCEWIDNGKAWDCIERRFSYLSYINTD